MKKWLKTLISLIATGMLVWVLCLFLIDDMLNLLNISLNPDEYVIYWFTIFILVEFAACITTVYLLNRRYRNLTKQSR